MKDLSRETASIGLGLVGENMWSQRAALKGEPHQNVLIGTRSQYGLLVLCGTSQTKPLVLKFKRFRLIGLSWKLWRRKVFNGHVYVDLNS